MGSTWKAMVKVVLLMVDKSPGSSSLLQTISSVTIVVKHHVHNY